MKYPLLAFVLLVQSALCVVGGYYISYNHHLKSLTPDLKVGDCVREIGSQTTEQITFISAKGAVETEYKFQANGNTFKSAYSNDQTLVPENCSNLK